MARDAQAIARVFLVSTAAARFFEGTARQLAGVTNREWSLIPPAPSNDKDKRLVVPVPSPDPLAGPTAIFRRIPSVRADAWLIDQSG